MQIMILIGFVLLVSLVFGVVVLIALINFGVLPRPEPDQLAACLDWREHFRVSPSERIPLPQIVFPDFQRTTASLAVVAPLIIGVTTMLLIGRSFQGSTAATVIQGSTTATDILGN